MRKCSFVAMKMCMEPAVAKRAEVQQTCGIWHSPSTTARQPPPARQPPLRLQAQPRQTLFCKRCITVRRVSAAFLPIGSSSSSSFLLPFSFFFSVLSLSLYLAVCARLRFQIAWFFLPNQAQAPVIQTLSQQIQIKKGHDDDFIIIITDADAPLE